MFQNAINLDVFTGEMGALSKPIIIIHRFSSKSTVLLKASQTGGDTPIFKILLYLPPIN
jgi:hypothetical protein